ncbi:hypothetical protein GCM10010464_87570 [Pseudonocardia yunnanensis]
MARGPNPGQLGLPLAVCRFLWWDRPAGAMGNATSPRGLSPSGSDRAATIEEILAKVRIVQTAVKRLVDNNAK